MGFHRSEIDLVLFFYSVFGTFLAVFNIIAWQINWKMSDVRLMHLCFSLREKYLELKKLHENEEGPHEKSKSPKGQ